MSADGGPARRLNISWVRHTPPCAAGVPTDARSISSLIRRRGTNSRARSSSFPGELPRELNLGHIRSILPIGERGSSSGETIPTRRAGNGTAAEPPAKFGSTPTVRNVLEVVVAQRQPDLADAGGRSRLLFSRSRRHRKHLFVRVRRLRRSPPHARSRNTTRRFPSTDGERIVYSAGGEIACLDAATNEVRRVPISRR